MCTTNDGRHSIPSTCSSSSSRPYTPGCWSVCSPEACRDSDRGLPASSLASLPVRWGTRGRRYRLSMPTARSRLGQANPGRPSRGARQRGRNRNTTRHPADVGNAKRVARLHLAAPLTLAGAALVLFLESAWTRAPLAEAWAVAALIMCASLPVGPLDGKHLDKAGIAVSTVLSAQPCCSPWASMSSRCGAPRVDDGPRTPDGQFDTGRAGLQGSVVVVLLTAVLRAVLPTPITLTKTHQCSARDGRAETRGHSAASRTVRLLPASRSRGWCASGSLSPSCRPECAFRSRPPGSGHAELHAIELVGHARRCGVSASSLPLSADTRSTRGGRAHGPRRSSRPGRPGCPRRAAGRSR